MKNMKRILLVLFCFSFILSACSNGGTSETGTSDDSISEAEKVLTIAMGTDVVSFDVHDHNNSSTEAVLVNLFSYLFKRDDSGQPQPELVDTYQRIDDLSWELTLKQGITFHNGDELTAEDVKFTLERVSKDTSLRDHANYNQIEEVQIVDDYTFIIVTKNPDPTLPFGLSRVGSGIMPKKYFEENGLEHFLSNPVGTGPYRFVEWAKDDRIILEPYENYFKGKVDEWDKVVFRVIPESSTRIAELLTGSADIAVDVPPSDWDRVNGNAGTSIVTGDTTRTMILVMRLTEGTPTADPLLREAIDYAIDNQALIDYMLGGEATPTRTRAVPTTFGSATELYDSYNYDLDRAKELVSKSSYAGEQLTFYSPRGRYLQDAEISEMIQGMLAQAGISVKLEFLEWSNFVEMRNAKNNKEMYFIGFGVSLGDAQQPMNYYLPERGAGETDYVNEEVHQLLLSAQGNMDEESRKLQLQRVQEIVAEDRPHIPLYAVKSIYGVNDRITFVPNVDEVIWVQDIKRK